METFIKHESAQILVTNIKENASKGHKWKKCQSNHIFIPPRMDFPYDALDKTSIKRLMSPQNITYNLTSHMLITINRSTISYRNETTRFVLNVPFQNHKNRFFVQTSISKWWFLITKTLKQFGGHEPRKPWTKLQEIFWQNWFKWFFSWSRQGMSWLGVSLSTFFFPVSLEQEEHHREIELM